ncbi:hypothetical protein Z043_112906, partial [Scleropages formosus]
RACARGSRNSASETSGWRAEGGGGGGGRRTEPGTLRGRDASARSLPSVKLKGSQPRGSSLPSFRSFVRRFRRLARMGSRLSRQSSLDGDAKFARRRREPRDGPGDAQGGAGGRAAGDLLLASLMLRSDKLPGMLRKPKHSPYVRRVAWIREIQKLLRECKVEQAVDVLKLLRKDLGLEGTSLNDILYKNAAFLNLVDPISHELLLSLARDMQCPKKALLQDADTLKNSDKICRQLIYHLTPHSKWLRQSMPRRKSQAW